MRAQRCSQSPSFFLSLIVFLFIQLLFPALAQTSMSTSTSASPSTSGPVPSIVSSTSSYAYVGCYNETTGVNSTGDARALAGGSMNASDSMTVETCLSFCGPSQYAGLEYGRECWCAPQLNSISPKLSDAECALPCTGNKTEICGGSLKLTTYQRKPGAKSNATKTNTYEEVCAILFMIALHIVLY